MICLWSVCSFLLMCRIKLGVFILLYKLNFTTCISLPDQCICIRVLSWFVIWILLFLFLAKKNWRVFKCLYSCYLTQWCTQLYACNVAVWSKVKIAPSHLGCSEIDYIFVWKKTKQALLKCYRIKNIDLFLQGLPTFEGKIGS